MSARRLVFAFLLVLTALRLVYISRVELAPDEAYYFQWAQRMDWSYFSKGPGVASAIWLGTHLFGDNEFGVRFLSPLLALGTSLVMFSFARRLYGESVAAWAVLMMNCTPIFQVGSLVMTIDPLSIFFWASALYTFWLALERSPAFTAWWPLTGLLIGLGFLAKYTAAMQLLSILLLLAATRKYRGELLRPGFFSLLLAFGVCTIPPIIWNSRHMWITLDHLSARGGLNSGFRVDIGGWLEFVGSHFGAYSPLIFLCFCAALWWGIQLAKQHFKPRFLVAFSLPLIALYLVLSLKQPGEVNWTAPAMISLGILTAAIWHEWSTTSVRARRFCGAALLIGAAISVLTLNLDALRSAGIPLPYRADPSGRLRGWQSAAEKVEEFRAKFETEQGAPAFLIANKYGSAASLAFYLKDKRIEGAGHPPVYVPEAAAPESQYFFWPRYDENLALPPGTAPKEDFYSEELGYNPFLGRNALYITDRAEERPPSTIKRGFERVEMIAVFDQERRGLPLRQLRIFACYHYKQVDL